MELHGNNEPKTLLALKGNVGTIDGDDEKLEIKYGSGIPIKQKMKLKISPEKLKVFHYNQPVKVLIIEDKEPRSGD